MRWQPRWANGGDVVTALCVMIGVFAATVLPSTAARAPQEATAVVAGATAPPSDCAVNSVTQPYPRQQPLSVLVGPDQNLPSTETMGIVEDSEGFIWIATIGGLIRWDGTRATRVGGTEWTDRLGQDTISGLIPDSRSGVWAAAGTLAHISSEGEVADTGLPALFLAPGPNGQFWIWNEETASLYDPVAKQIVLSTKHEGSDPDEAPTQSVTMVTSAPNGDLGFLDHNRQLRVVSSTGAVVVHSELGMAQALGRRRAGGFWVYNGHEIQGFDNGTLMTTPAREPVLGKIRAATAIYETVEGAVLLPTYENGVQRLANGAWDQLPIGFVQHAGTFDHLIEDSRGILWFSEFGAGVHGVMPFTSGAGRWLPDDLDLMVEHDLLDVLLLGDEVWVATDGDGLYVLNRRTGSYRVLRQGLPTGAQNANGRSGPLATGSLPNDSVIGLACVGGKVWAGMWDGGIAIIDPGTLATRVLSASPSGALHSNNVFDITTDAHGDPWAAVWGSGVAVMTPQGDRLGLIGPGGDIDTVTDRPIAVVPSADASLARRTGSVLIGGWSGLEIVDLASGTVRRWSNTSKQLRGNIVYSVADGGNGIVWLGTSSGLERLDTTKSGSVSTVTDIQQGLPGTQVFTVTRRGDQLLLGTERGLVLTDSAPRPHVRTVLTEEDGLSATAMARYGHVVAPEGTLYLATANGLSTLTPDGPLPTASPEHKVEPDAKLTFLVDDSPVPGATARIDAGQGGQVRVKIQPQTYWRPEVVRSEYRLVQQGVPEDEPWMPVGLAALSVPLTTPAAPLSPGTYRFEYRVFDQTGKSRTLAPLTLMINERWYSTVRFRLLLLFMVLLSVGWFLRKSWLTRARWEDEAAARTAEVELRRGEAEQATREIKNLLHRVSHDLRSPLNNIVGAMDLLRSGPSDRSAIERWSGMANASGRRLTVMLDDLIAYARSETNRAEPIVPEAVDIRAAVEEAMVMAGASGPDARRVVTARFEQSSRTVLAEPESLRQLFTDLLLNAVVYSRPGDVTILCQDGETPAVVRIQIIDPGSDLSEDELRVLAEPYRRGEQVGGVGLGLGLTVAQSLANRLGGSFSLNTTADQTVAEVQLPATPEPIQRIVIGATDRTARAQLTAVLTKGDYSVRSADDAAKVGPLIAEFLPDLVIVEHHFGHHIGADVLAEVAGRAASPWAPRVIGIAADPLLARRDARYAIVLAMPVVAHDVLQAIARVDPAVEETVLDLDRATAPVRVS